MNPILTKDGNILTSNGKALTGNSSGGNNVKLYKHIITWHHIDINSGQDTRLIITIVNTSNTNIFNNSSELITYFDWRYDTGYFIQDNAYCPCVFVGNSSDYGFMIYKNLEEYTYQTEYDNDLTIDDETYLYGASYSEVIEEVIEKWQ